jgi:hypothetical protein
LGLTFFAAASLSVLFRCAARLGAS